MDKIIYAAQLQYLSQFKNQNDKLITEMEKFAKEHNVPILSWQAAAFLEVLIKMVNPKRVLEIGTAIAYSSIRIARNLKKKGVVHTIEKSKDNIVLAKGYIKKSGVEEKIKIMEGNAFEIMPELEKKYDFIFLDADKNEYSRLFQLSVPLLKKGGVIFVDNLLWGGNTAADKVPPKLQASTEFIRKFNKEFIADPRIKAVIIPVGDGLGIGVKN
ncbi:MAG: O-methyltransferase [Ignavibacteriaceae bacterium]|nr:O-methyltransferase [Ignavibacteriaceae bacterium]